MSSRKLSQNEIDRQKQREVLILEMIGSFQKLHGYSPSVRDICNQTGITSASIIQGYLDRLQAMGYLHRERRISRSIRLTRPLCELEQL